MFLIHFDQDGSTHAVATGRVVGKYKTYQNDRGFLTTEFTICVKQTRERKYVTLKVAAYGESSAETVKYCKENREVIVALGNCAVDKEMTELRGIKHYAMYASAVLSPSMIVETWRWHKGTVRYGELIEQEFEKNIRYDYETNPSEDDHRI